MDIAKMKHANDVYFLYQKLGENFQNVFNSLQRDYQNHICRLIIQDGLVGTCRGYSEIFEGYGLDVEQFPDAGDYWFETILDEEAFECQSCGWWFEAGYNFIKSGEPVCEGCIED
jgi:hypothetical protein